MKNCLVNYRFTRVRLFKFCLSDLQYLTSLLSDLRTSLTSA